MEDSPSSDQPLPPPEISETQPHETPYHEANEIETPLETDLGIREAEELRGVCYEIGSSIGGVKVVGRSQSWITSLKSIALVSLALRGGAKDDDVGPILEEGHSQEDPINGAEENSKADTSNGLVTA